MGVGGGGGGEVQKNIYHAREDLSEKNSCMQSRLEKNGLLHILHKSQEGMQESILYAKHQLFEQTFVEFWSCIKIIIPDAKKKHI